MNPITGEAVTIGQLTDNFASLAFDEKSNLYGVTGDGATVAETIYLVDQTNGLATHFMTLGNGDDGETIAYNYDNGFMYHYSGWSNSNQVWEEIDLNSQSIVDSNSFSENMNLLGIIYDVDNNFMIGAERLSSGFFRLDPTDWNSKEFIATNSANIAGKGFVFTDCKALPLPITNTSATDNLPGQIDISFTTPDNTDLTEVRVVRKLGTCEDVGVLQDINDGEEVATITNPLQNSNYSY